MSNGTWRDVSRQAANVLGAIFQIAVAIWVGPAVGRVSGENPTLVVPGDYAFVIWSPIFLLALVYAVYQALPANREKPLLRRIGWFSALAYFSNGVWEIVFPAREFVLSQLVFVGITGGAVASFVLVQRGAGSGGRFDRWLLAPAFGCSPAGSRRLSSSASSRSSWPRGCWAVASERPSSGRSCCWSAARSPARSCWPGGAGRCRATWRMGGPCCGPSRGWWPTSTRTP